jgi:hypothetical protein
LTDEVSGSGGLRPWRLQQSDISLLPQTSLPITFPHRSSLPLITSLRYIIRALFAPPTNMTNHLDTKHGGRSSTSISKDLEKVNVYEHNKYAGMGLTHEETDFYENFPEDQRKAMIRKVDFRLVPVLAVLYLFSHIDRANIGNAKIEGMMEDLGMSGIQYNIV